MDLTDDPEHDELESTWDRWQRLPLGYRVNACLYVLGFISLVVLLTQVVSDSGGKPRQVEVASRAPSTTRPPRVTTTPRVPPPTTAIAPVAPALPLPPAPAAGASGGGGAPSGGGPAPAAPPDTEPIPGFPFTTVQRDCRDSRDPGCGTFSWDPAAGANLPVAVNVSRSPSSGVNKDEPVAFTVVVTDADHAVGDNCSVVDFGDGDVLRAPCQPLSCPGAFGQWTPPARVPGSATFTYFHAYRAPGTYTATFEYHTDRDRCPDPYGNFGRGSASVTVSDPAPAPGT